jgi:autotransporter-associated beta strand protein
MSLSARVRRFFAHRSARLALSINPHARVRSRRLLIERLEDRAVPTITITQLVPPSATEGTNTGQIAVATFADSNPAFSAPDFTTSIIWGDGITDPGIVADNGNGTFSVIGNHTYAEEGSGISFAVTVSDPASFSDTKSATIAVADASLKLVSEFAPNAAVEGKSTGTITVGTFSDSNPTADINDLGASISWGDGVTSAGTIVANPDGTFSVKASHTYGEELVNGLFGVDFTDKGGSILAAPIVNVNVVDQSVSAMGGLTITATEGIDTGSQTLATFTDPAGPEPLADYSASIDWGDNTVATSGTITFDNTTGLFMISGDHTYADAGLHTITVTTHHDSAVDTVAKSMAMISDAALAIVGVTPPSASEGIDTGTVSVATFSDANPNPNITDFTAGISWGDGTTSPGTLVANADGTFTVQGSHKYSEEAAELGLAVMITDKDGATVTGNGSVHIADADVSPTGGFTVTATEASASGSQTVATFSDPGGPESNSDYSASIDWGDGSATSSGVVAFFADPSTFSVQGNHTYAEEGTFTITVTISHDSSTPQTATSMANVGDVSVSATGGFTIVGAPGCDTGSEFPLLPGSNQTLATFTDPAGSEPVANYSASIDWGDGPTSAGTVTLDTTTHVYTVTGSHSYAAMPGVHTFSDTITVTIGNDTATPVMVTDTAQISDILNYTANANAATTIDPASLQVSSVDNTTISICGIQTLNLITSGAVSTLLVDDSADTMGQTVTLSAEQITGFMKLPVINYGNLSMLTLSGGSGGNSFDVKGTPTGTAVTLNTGSSLDATNIETTGGDLTIHGQGSVNGASGTLNGTLTIDTSGLVTVSEQLGGPGGLTKAGSGTATLTAPNGYMGSTAIQAGILRVSGSGTLGTGSLVLAGGVLENTGSFGLSNSFTVPVSGSGFVAMAPLTISGNGTLDGEMTINATGTSAVISVTGRLTGMGGVTKTGPGTAELTADNAYSGDTNVEAGILLIDGMQPASHIAVLAGATIGGVGTTGTIISTGGTVHPGDIAAAPGILHVSGDATFDPDSRLSVAVLGTTAGTGYSQLNVRGTVTLNQVQLVARQINPLLTRSIAQESATSPPLDIVEGGSVMGTTDLQEGDVFFAFGQAGKDQRVHYVRSGMPQRVQLLVNDVTHVALSSSPNPSAGGQTVMVTATVTSDITTDGIAPGCVTFFQVTGMSQTPLGAALLINGMATFPVSLLNANAQFVAEFHDFDPARGMFCTPSGTVSSFSNSVSNTVSQTVQSDANIPYVTAIYHRVLNRTPGATESAAWVQYLDNGGSRTVVATAFWASPEHRGIQVDGFYMTYLGRPADPRGRDSWVAAMVAGVSELEVIDDFIASPEYQNAHASDASYVDSLYANILGRSDTDAERNSWVTFLQRGGTREQIALTFKTSFEYDIKIVDAYYVNLLNRIPGRDEGVSWVICMLNAVCDQDTVAEAFLASGEFFARAGSL